MSITFNFKVPVKFYLFNCFHWEGCETEFCSVLLPKICSSWGREFNPDLWCESTQLPEALLLLPRICTARKMESEAGSECGIWHEDILVGVVTAECLPQWKLYRPKFKFWQFYVKKTCCLEQEGRIEHFMNNLLWVNVHGHRFFVPVCFPPTLIWSIEHHHSPGRCWNLWTAVNGSVNFELGYSFE